MFLLVWIFTLVVEEISEVSKHVFGVKRVMHIHTLKQLV